MHHLPTPYLVHVGDDPRPEKSKMAVGLATFNPDICTGILTTNTTLAIDLPTHTLASAKAAGATALVLGSIGPNGHIDPAWIPDISAAIQMGYHIINGHHDRLSNLAASPTQTIGELAKAHGVSLIDVRHYDGDLSVGTGQPRAGHRVLTVGTDCSCGKMFTSLSLSQYLTRHNTPNQFIATGQTGIVISGSGIPIDAIVSDYLSGAIESLTPPSDTIQIIEGQGSLFHPAYAGVSLGLLHGAQADHLILCHNPSSQTMLNTDYPIPDLAECLALNLQLGRRTNPNQTCMGISLNTRDLSERNAKAVIAQLENDFRVPVCDPYRFGIDGIGEVLI